MAKAKKYDRICVSVTGFLKKTIQEKAKTRGVSVSTYIKDLVRLDIKKV
jgi:hypothetical protein